MFDDIIKNKANEHEAPVPPGAWDNIAKKKKKRRFIIFWWAAGIMLLAAFSVGGYYLINNNTTGSKKNIAAEKPAPKNTNNIAAESNPSINSNEETAAETQGSNTKTDGTPNIASKEDGQPVVPIDKSGSNTKTDKGNLSTQTLTPNTNEAGNASIGKNENKTVDNKPLLAASNKIKKSTKGKLYTKQTNLGIDESVAANEKAKAIIDKPVADENFTEETNAEEKKELAIAGVPDKKIITTEEEKKTNETVAPTKPGQLSKGNIAIAKHKIKKHWFFEAAAIPLIASSQYNKNIPFRRTLVANNGTSVYKANLKSASIEPAVAFSFFLHRQVSKKMDMGTGLQYMLLKENMHIEGKETNTTYTIVNRLVNGRLLPDTVATVTEGTRVINAVNSYQLFSIPLFLQYNILENKQWSIGAVGGFYFNISSNYKDEINRNAAAPLQGAPGTRDKNNTGVDIFAGLRIGKKLNKRFDFFAMPSIRLSLAKYGVKNGLLDKNINQGGVGFGVSYKIN